MSKYIVALRIVDDHGHYREEYSVEARGEAEARAKALLQAKATYGKTATPIIDQVTRKES